MRRRRFLALLLCLCLVSCRAEPPREAAFSFEKENVRGNTNGNLANLGLAASQGEWIFFCDMADGGMLKATRDGGKTCAVLMESFDDAYACLNLVGQKLSYISSLYGDINAVLLDEETAVSLWAGHSYCMQVADGGTWLIDESGDGFVKRFDEETGDAVSYGTHPAYVENVSGTSLHTSFSLDNGYLYYAAADDGNRVYRVDLTSGAEEKIVDTAVTTLVAENGSVYYTDAASGRLYRLANGQLFPLTQTRVGTFNVEGKVVWYTDGSQAGSPVMRLENGVATRVCDVKDTMYLCRVNGLLMLYGEESGITFVSDDGTCVKP